MTKVLALKVGAAQAAGTYSNESGLFVTVNYNQKNQN